MNRPIVVPLDGSDFAEVALPMGRTLAELTMAPLHLVHVLASPVPSAFHPEERLELEDMMGREGSGYVEEQASALRSESRVPVVTTLLHGDEGVARAISEYGEEVDARWIVLTTHGAGGVTRLVRGSVADALGRSARTPLMFIRPWDATGSLGPSERRFRWILVPLDGSEESEAALVPAAVLARVTGASLSLVRVIPPVAASRVLSGSSLVAGSSAIEREAALYLEDLVEELRGRRLGVESWVVANRSVAAGVLTTAIERGVDLIVMATHGRGGFERLVLGSVADEVLRKSTVPLALVRPDGEEQIAIREVLASSMPRDHIL